jgi:ferredoxin
MPTVSVTIVKSGSNGASSKDNSTFELNGSEIIYDGLDRQGHKLPAGCLAGSCGTCKVNIISGIENCHKAGSVEQDTVNHISKTYKEKNGANAMDGKNLRLACRAKITGPVTIEIFEA